MSYEAALDSAVRALRHRDRTSAQLGRQLAERGFDDAARREALATLVRTGVLDDARYAENRARALAERGAGNAYIRHDLAGAGLASDEIDDAVAWIDPEHERAERIVERRGASPKTARYLAGKGFPEDLVRGVIAQAAGEALG